MTDLPLFFTVIGLVVTTAYLIATAKPLTDEERKEMEDEW
jgi:hypothetical protein